MEIGSDAKAGKSHDLVLLIKESRKRFFGRSTCCSNQFH